MATTTHRCRRAFVAAALAFTSITAGVAGVAPGPLDNLTPAAAIDPAYEPDSAQGSIYRLYRAYFLREPDVEGFNYWLWTYASGSPITDISQNFTRSAEFQSDYGNVSDRDFITLVYRNVLDRAPDEAGYAYWVDQMQNRGMSRGVLMINFSDSAEFRSNTATGVPPGHRAGANAANVLATLTVAVEVARGGYERELFKHWDDADGDGCGTRCEVLAAERRADNTWFSLWDGVTTSNAGDLHIDHVVALAEAWDSGAHAWDAQTRDAFADDWSNLTAVTASSNLSKSDDDPAEWSPPRAASACIFAQVTVSVKAEWKLAVDSAEKSALSNMLSTCGTGGSTAPPPPPPSGCETDGVYTAANGACVADYEDSTRDVDCGQLPAATKPVKVHNPGNDPYGLDGDGDGSGCTG